MVCAILTAVLFVAYANGSNDNFKGVASLLGSGTTDYKRALAWACATTFAGSLTSVFFAEKLIKTFSGKGLVVPETLTTDSSFLLAVALGAALTVMTATWIGAPISTTHGLTGALVGAGLAAGGSIQFAALGEKFLKPLLLSPLISLLLAGLLYTGIKLYRIQCRKVYERLVTSRPLRFPGPQPAPSPAEGLAEGPPFLKAGTYDPQRNTKLSSESGAIALLAEKCCGDEFCGISNRRWVDTLHYLSAGALSFARGLNDSPKIVAILVASQFAGIKGGLAAVAILMLLGGALNAKKVAETMSRRITKMNPDEGASANIVASFLVVVASKWGIPVSTTHVTAGGLFGIGLVNGKANWKVIGSIVGAWFVTLPMAAVLAAGVFKATHLIMEGHF